MGTRTSRAPYPAELRERAVWMVREHEGEHASRSAAVRSVAGKVGCHRETLRLWLRQAERDDGVRPGPTTEERERIRALERENRELRQANEILREAGAYFAQAELDRPSKRRSPSSTSSPWCRHRSEAHGGRAVHGVEPICRLLPIAPSTYYAHRVARRDPAKRSARRNRDDALCLEIARVHSENFGLSRRAQGLVAAAPRGGRGGPVHRGAADASDGAAGRGARQDREDHDPGPGRAVPAGPREAPVPRARAEHALGQRLHLRRDVAEL